MPHPTRLTRLTRTRNDAFRFGVRRSIRCATPSADGFNWLQAEPSAGFSRRVLSRIISSRIGHGVLLLDDANTVELLREHGICLDMCPVSNTSLGVHDWTLSSLAARTIHLGLPVTINSDDPVLFGVGLAANLALTDLSSSQS